MNDLETIQKKIYEIRGQLVMLDRDLAEFGVTFPPSTNSRIL